MSSPDVPEGPDMPEGPDVSEGPVVPEATEPDVTEASQQRDASALLDPEATRPEGPGPDVSDTVEPEPYHKPSDEEQQDYYYGLYSRPKLIARSSDTTWAPKISQLAGDFGPVPKRMGPVGRHPLVELWNNSTGSVRNEIIQCLKGCQWNAIDIVRIGYIDATDKWPIIMLISVDPGSTTWADGNYIVRRCKEVLSRHNVNDVECEMKEGQLLNLTAPETDTHGPPVAHRLRSAASLDKGHWRTAEMFLTDSLGESIAPSTMRTHEGTKGLYLERIDDQGNNQGTLVLTCRHVVLSAASDARVDFQYGEGNDQHTMVQPGDNTLERTVKRMDGYESWAVDHLNKFSDREYHNDVAKANNEKRLSDLRASLDSTRAFRQRLQAVADPQARIFGHLLYARGLELRENRWMSDWALIELHQDRHEQSLASLKNVIDIPQGPNAEICNHVVVHYGHLKEQLPHPRALQLVDDLIPLSEMNDPEYTNLANDPSILVGKQGAKTGVTWGWSNSARSITRHPSGREELISEEWCIVPVHDSRAFSQPGDSGSCVWDLDGRIGGILTGGSGNGVTVDVTYATPMERIMQDIKACGFNVRVPKP